MSAGVERIRVPLLHDNHNHLSLYAAMSGALDISSMDSGDALTAMAALPADRLSLVRGWRTQALPLGERELSSLPPVLVVNISLHGFAASHSGRRHLADRLPELAARGDDAEWCEAHVPEVFAAYCELGGVNAERLTEKLDEASALGMGSADDMAVADEKSIDAYIQKDTKALCSLFVGMNLYEKLSIPRRKAVKGIKFFIDGSIGSRSAAIGRAFKGSGKAVLNYDKRSLSVVLSKAREYGTGASIHAIGEIAIGIALDAIESAGPLGRWSQRPRLEHVQFIDEAQARRAKDLGLVLSMQPNFSTDSVDYADRLPSGYPERNNPFRMLIDEAGFVPGDDLIFGSDGMPTGLAYAARASLFPAEPGQRLSVEELLAGYGPSRLRKGEFEIEIDHDRKDARVIAER